MDGHTWVRHVETGGYWRCPDGVLDEMRAKGWVPSDPPEEPNLATAEALAWRRSQAVEAAAREAEITTPTEAATRGESEGVSDG